jgi:hypothetical protein
MGAWAIVFEDEVEGRLVTVKVYQSDEPEDQDEAPAVRVITTAIDEGAGRSEVISDGEAVARETRASDRTITLEPYSLDDLEGELVELGFRPEAAVSIIRKIPV